MNAIGKKWMAKELYEQCPICDGDGEIPDGKFSGPYARTQTTPGNIECPGCVGNGFVAVGLTVGQVERMKAINDLLAKACVEAMRFLDRQGYDAGYCDAHGHDIRGTLQYAILKARTEK